MEAKRNMSGLPKTQLLNTHTHAPGRKSHGGAGMVAVIPAGSEVDLWIFSLEGFTAS